MNKSALSLASIVSLLVLCSLLSAQSAPFVGTWRSPHWKPKNSRGIVLHIVQNEYGLSGTVHFYDPRSDHESRMLHPKLSGGKFAFDVDDEYVGSKLWFSMTLNKDGKSAVVKGGGGHMLLEQKVVKQP